MPLDPHLLQLYLVAAVVIVLAPGPDSLLVLGRSLFEGRRAGLFAMIGVIAGVVVHAGLAGLGVSALIAASPQAFEAVRIAGAGYLVWLGLRALLAARRAAREGAQAAAFRPPVAGRPLAMASHGFLTNLLNPKIVLFYLAFVPQFVAAERGAIGLQTFLLGLILAGLGALYLTVLAILASGAGRRIAGSPRFRVVTELGSGLIFLGFALRMIFVERRVV